MGEQPDSEVWDLTLQLEGLSLRLLRTRTQNPSFSAPVPFPRLIRPHLLQCLPWCQVLLLDLQIS